jgi:hypothetical protein
MNALVKFSNAQSEYKRLHMNMAKYIFFQPLNFAPSLDLGMLTIWNNEDADLQ